MASSWAQAAGRVTSLARGPIPDDAIHPKDLAMDASASLSAVNRSSMRLVEEPIRVEVKRCISIDREKAWPKVLYRPTAAGGGVRDGRRGTTRRNIAPADWTFASHLPPFLALDPTPSDSRLAELWPSGDCPRAFFEKSLGKRFRTTAASASGSFVAGCCMDGGLFLWNTKLNTISVLPSPPVAAHSHFTGQRLSTDATHRPSVFVKSETTTMASTAAAAAGSIQSLFVADDGRSLLLLTCDSSSLPPHGTAVDVWLWRAEATCVHAPTARNARSHANASALASGALQGCWCKVPNPPPYVRHALLFPSRACFTAVFVHPRTTFKHGYWLCTLACPARPAPRAASAAVPGAGALGCAEREVEACSNDDATCIALWHCIISLDEQPRRLDSPSPSKPPHPLTSTELAVYSGTPPSICRSVTTAPSKEAPDLYSRPPMYTFDDVQSTLPTWTSDYVQSVAASDASAPLVTAPSTASTANAPCTPPPQLPVSSAQVSLHDRARLVVDTQRQAEIMVIRHSAAETSHSISCGSPPSTPASPTSPLPSDVPVLAARGPHPSMPSLRWRISSPTTATSALNSPSSSPSLSHGVRGRGAQSIQRRIFDAAASRRLPLSSPDTTPGRLGNPSAERESAPPVRRAHTVPVPALPCSPYPLSDGLFEQSARCRVLTTYPLAPGVLASDFAPHATAAAAPPTFARRRSSLFGGTVQRPSAVPTAQCLLLRWDRAASVLAVVINAVHAADSRVVFFSFPPLGECQLHEDGECAEAAGRNAEAASDATQPLDSDDGVAVHMELPQLNDEKFDSGAGLSTRPAFASPGGWRRVAAADGLASATTFFGPLLTAGAPASSVPARGGADAAESARLSQLKYSVTDCAWLGGHRAAEGNTLFLSLITMAGDLVLLPRVGCADAPLLFASSDQPELAALLELVPRPCLSLRWQDISRAALLLDSKMVSAGAKAKSKAKKKVKISTAGWDGTQVLSLAAHNSEPLLLVSNGDIVVELSLRNAALTPLLASVLSSSSLRSPFSMSSLLAAWRLLFSYPHRFDADLLKLLQLLVDQLITLAGHGVSRVLDNQHQTRPSGFLTSGVLRDHADTEAHSLPNAKGSGRFSVSSHLSLMRETLSSTVLSWAHLHQHSALFAACTQLIARQVSRVMAHLQSEVAPEMESALHTVGSVHPVVLVAESLAAVQESVESTFNSLFELGWQTSDSAAMSCRILKLFAPQWHLIHVSLCQLGDSILRQCPPEVLRIFRRLPSSSTTRLGSPIHSPSAIGANGFLSQAWNARVLSSGALTKEVNVAPVDSARPFTNSTSLLQHCFRLARRLEWTDLIVIVNRTLGSHGPGLAPSPRSAITSSLLFGPQIAADSARALIFVGRLIFSTFVAPWVMLPLAFRADASEAPLTPAPACFSFSVSDLGIRLRDSGMVAAEVSWNLLSACRLFKWCGATDQALELIVACVEAHDRSTWTPSDHLQVPIAALPSVRKEHVFSPESPDAVFVVGKDPFSTKQQLLSLYCALALSDPTLADRHLRDPITRYVSHASASCDLSSLLQLAMGCSDISHGARALPHVMEALLMVAKDWTQSVASAVNVVLLRLPSAPFGSSFPQSLSGLETRPCVSVLSVLCALVSSKPARTFSFQAERELHAFERPPEPSTAAQSPSRSPRSVGTSSSMTSASGFRTGCSTADPQSAEETGACREAIARPAPPKWINNTWAAISLVALVEHYATIGADRDRVWQRECKELWTALRSALWQLDLCFRFLQLLAMASPNVPLSPSQSESAILMLSELTDSLRSSDNHRLIHHVQRSLISFANDFATAATAKIVGRSAMVSSVAVSRVWHRLEQSLGAANVLQPNLAPAWSALAAVFASVRLSTVSSSSPNSSPRSHENSEKWVLTQREFATSWHLLMTELHEPHALASNFGDVCAVRAWVHPTSFRSILRLLLQTLGAPNTNVGLPVPAASIMSLEGKAGSEAIGTGGSSLFTMGSITSTAQVHLSRAIPAARAHKASSVYRFGVALASPRARAEATPSTPSILTGAISALLPGTKMKARFAGTQNAVGLSSQDTLTKVNISRKRPLFHLTSLRKDKRQRNHIVDLGVMFRSLKAAEFSGEREDHSSDADSKAAYVAAVKDNSANVWPVFSANATIPASPSLPRRGPLFVPAAAAASRASARPGAESFPQAPTPAGHLYRIPIRSHDHLDGPTAIVKPLTFSVPHSGGNQSAAVRRSATTMLFRVPSPTFESLSSSGRLPLGVKPLASLQAHLVDGPFTGAAVPGAPGRTSSFTQTQRSPSPPFASPALPASPMPLPPLLSPRLAANTSTLLPNPSLRPSSPTTAATVADEPLPMRPPPSPGRVVAAAGTDRFRSSTPPPVFLSHSRAGSAGAPLSLSAGSVTLGSAVVKPTESSPAAAAAFLPHTMRPVSPQFAALRPLSPPAGVDLRWRAGRHFIEDAAILSVPVALTTSAGPRLDRPGSAPNISRLGSVSPQALRVAPSDVTCTSAPVSPTAVASPSRELTPRALKETAPRDELFVESSADALYSVPPEQFLQRDMQHAPPRAAMRQERRRPQHAIPRFHCLPQEEEGESPAPVPSSSQAHSREEIVERKLRSILEASLFVSKDTLTLGRANRSSAPPELMEPAAPVGVDAPSCSAPGPRTALLKMLGAVDSAAAHRLPAESALLAPPSRHFFPMQRYSLPSHAHTQPPERPDSGAPHSQPDPDYRQVRPRLPAHLLFGSVSSSEAGPAGSSGRVLLDSAELLRPPVHTASAHRAERFDSLGVPPARGQHNFFQDHPFSAPIELVEATLDARTEMSRFRSALGDVNAELVQLQHLAAQAAQLDHEFKRDKETLDSYVAADFTSRVASLDAEIFDERRQSEMARSLVNEIEAIVEQHTLGTPTQQSLLPSDSVFTYHRHEQSPLRGVLRDMNAEFEEHRRLELSHAQLRKSPAVTPRGSTTTCSVRTSQLPTPSRASGSRSASTMVVHRTRTHTGSTRLPRTAGRGRTAVKKHLSSDSLPSQFSDASATSFLSTDSTAARPVRDVRNGHTSASKAAGAATTSTGSTTSSSSRRPHSGPVSRTTPAAGTPTPTAHSHSVSDALHERDERAAAFSNESSEGEGSRRHELADFAAHLKRHH